MGELGVKLAPGVYHKGFVSVLGDNIKDLLAEEVSSGKLSAALFEEGEADPALPESILISLYERYTDYLEEYGLADAAQLPTLARKAIDSARALDFIKEDRPRRFSLLYRRAAEARARAVRRGGGADASAGDGA